eukprot:gene3760-6648_t
MTSFELDRIHIHFNSIYTNEDMKNSFMKHLESEFNTEPFEFVLKVKEFESEEEEKLKLKLFFEIYDTYIIKNSPKEINLSAENLENFRKKNKIQLEDRNTNLLENEPFDILKRIIHSQLLHDVFPRFIRSDLCIKTIKLHQRDSKVVEKREVYDFPYKDEDFTSEIVTDIDIEFMNRLMKDGYDWELVFSDKKLQMNTFYFKNEYFPNVSFLKDSNIQKFESIIPFGLQHCIDALVPISQVKKYDRAIVDIKCKSYLDGDESLKKYPDQMKMKRSNAVFNITAKLPVPGSKQRRGLDATTTYFDHKGNWIRIMKPIIQNFIKKPNDWEKSHKEKIDGKTTKFYAMPSFLKFQLTPISENKTKYTYIHIFNICGSFMMKKMTKTVIQMRAKGLRSDLLSNIQKFDENMKKEAEENLENDGYSKLNRDAFRYCKEEHCIEE